ncbi:Coenzyme F420 hydrogenase/dehydrogenase, beta subunit C-terminal domain [Faecalibacterium sp. PGM34]
MIEITDKRECCGCTACFNACPSKCISMRPDEEGFLYPVVNKVQCVNCGVCEKVCPISNYKPIEGKTPVAYVVRTKNQNDLMQSTSGGFSTPLAQWFFSKGGSVWTASYDNDWNVVHREFTKDDAEFSKTRGSKYVQSYLGDVYTKILDELKEERWVCFIGTTCQVYGLKQFLRKDYERLITVDLVCHGTPSPKLWKKYIDYQTQKYNSQIEEINFRNKTYGYHSGTMMLKFENGKKYTGSARVDYMLKSFFSEISSRPSCYDCRFKQLNRVSDYTVFDCWHMGELLEREDDDKGYTNLLVHTSKGEKLLKELAPYYDIVPVDTEKAILFDGIMVCNSATPHKSREYFYEDLDEHGLDEHIQKYIKVTTKDRLLESIKGIAYKCGLMETLRKIKG